LSERPVALITGGSRGVGAAAAVAFARRGYDVVLTYRDKAKRASDVAGGVQRLGARALSVACNITRPADVRALCAAVAGWSGRLDALVLNASGGQEREVLAADPHYAMRINRDAQVALLDAALPLMARGATVVFVTSHWAHLYGRVEQLPAYAPIAESKHAGEQALRGRIDDLAGRGVRLLVVTGDLVQGTITPRLLERMARGQGMGEEGRGHVHDGAGPLPTTTDMGEAIAQAAADPALPSGFTVVVGRPLESVP
jgi:NAD(P)-dependent dehydrogenase (short-subunit alcohol dehydrogenase family)